MSRSTSIDLLLNITSRFAAGGLQFFFVPLYVSYLGPDGYGLLGLYVATLGLLLCADQAITPTVTRTFAQHGADNEKAGYMWETLRTTEIVSAMIGCSFGAIIFFSAPWIASHVVHSTVMSHQTTISAVRAMSLTLVCQWPSFVYSGALTGLRKQFPLNFVRTSVAVVQWVGGAALLIYFRSDVKVLFFWQATCFLFQSLALRWSVVKNMPTANDTHRFSPRILKQSWKFSVGTVLIGVTGAILTQGDKFFISHYSTLSSFTAYSLSFLLASLIGIFAAQPIATVAFPSFVKLLHASDYDGLAQSYRSWTQLTILIIAPTSAALIFFPQAILSQWMHKKPEIISEIVNLLPFVSMGTLLNLIMLLPFTLQIASGWTSLSTVKNLIILPIFILGLWKYVPIAGAITGATAWLMINAAYYFIEIPLMHRRLLPNVMWKWWTFDTLLPCLIVASITATIRYSTVTTRFSIEPIFACISAWIFSILVLAISFSSSRHFICILWTTIIAGRYKYTSSRI